MKIQALHHIAYKCGNAQATRDFYEGILGLPLTLTVKNTRVPTTGDKPVTYFHFFFGLGDGSSVAFFDLGDDAQPIHSPNTPSWVNHLALRMDTREELAEAHKRLLDAGIEVHGVIDHDFVESIYFFDPNGIRLELTTALDEGPEYLAKAQREAEGAFAEWVASRPAPVKQNQPV